MVENLTTGNFKTYIDKNNLVIVDYWADWCGPCKIMAPVFEEASKEFTKVKFAKLNVDEEAEVAQTYDVSSIPTLIIFHKGKEVERLVGFMPKGQFKAKLQEITKELK